MVESAILFMVGFLSAALLALLFVPAVSRRAGRLANARARLLSPLSESQAAAERDALRAVHAVAIVKMERKVEAAEWERGIARTDLARETSRIAKVVVGMRKLEVEAAEQARLFDALSAELRAAEAESAAKEIALSDITGQRDAAQRRLAQARTNIAELEAHSDRSRVEVATLATQVSALEVELSDARAGRGRFGGESAKNLQERLQASENAREDQTLELARMMRSAAERSAGLAKSEALRETLERRLAEFEQRAEPELGTKPLAMSMEATNGSGTLSEERDSRGELQSEIDRLQSRLVELSASSEALTKGDAALRLAIAKLGRDLARGRLDEPAGAAQVVNFARREPMA